MKRTLLAASLAALAASAAQAQSSYTLYGLIDTTLRITNNEASGGARKLQMTEGALTGTRWGLRGVEDLGGGLKAKFVAESGFSPDTGGLLQGGALFGRQVYVGLEGEFGDVRMGRQYTVAHEIISSYESMAIANLSIVGYQGSQYTGLRFNDMVRYSKQFGQVSVVGGYSFGEVTGNVRSKAAQAIGGAYDDGKLRIGGVYQTKRDVNTYFGTTVANSKQTTWSFGGTYDLQPVKLYAGYTDHKLDAARLHNKAFYTGFNYTVTPSSNLIGTVTFDKLDSAGTSGKRMSGGLMYDYLLSKRTDVYVEADYTRMKDAWMTVATTSGFSTPFFAGRDTRTGLMVGLRHRF